MTNAAPASAPAAGAAATGAAATGTEAPNAATIVGSPANVAAQQAAAAAAAQTTEGAAAAGAEAGETGQQVDTTGWPAEAVAAYTKAQAAAARYQREAGDSRINAKANAAAAARAEILADLTKVLNPDAAEGAQLSAEQLTEQITTERTRGDGAELRADMIAAAWAQGVDPAQLGYLEFKLGQSPEYKALDRSDPEFSTKLTASIAAQVAADARLAGTPGGATTSGVETLGGANGGTAITADAFKAMSMADRNALFFSDKATYDQLVAATR